MVLFSLGWQGHRLTSSGNYKLTPVCLTAGSIPITSRRRSNSDVQLLDALVVILPNQVEIPQIAGRGIQEDDESGPSPVLFERSMDQLLVRAEGGQHNHSRATFSIGH